MRSSAMLMARTNNRTDVATARRSLPREGGWESMHDSWTLKGDCSRGCGERPFSAGARGTAGTADAIDLAAAVPPRRTGQREQQMRLARGSDALASAPAQRASCDHRSVVDARRVLQPRGCPFARLRQEWRSKRGRRKRGQASPAVSPKEPAKETRSKLTTFDLSASTPRACKRTGARKALMTLLSGFS
jgi:hypothetical protein